MYNKEEIKDILNTAKDKGLISAIPTKSKTQEGLAELLTSENPDLLAESQVQDPNEKAYQSAIDEEIGNNIPVPHEVEGDVPNLPLDLTELSDKQLMRLHGGYNALSARVGWLYAIEEAGADACKKIVDGLEENYMSTADRKDFGGKAKAMNILKAEALISVPELKKWKTRYNKHSTDAGKLKRLLDIFNNNCERISRQWTMRTIERDHA